MLFGAESGPLSFFGCVTVRRYHATHLEDHITYRLENWVVSIDIVKRHNAIDESAQVRSRLDVFEVNFIYKSKTKQIQLNIAK